MIDEDPLCKFENEVGHAIVTVVGGVLMGFSRVVKKYLSVHELYGRNVSEVDACLVQYGLLLCCRLLITSITSITSISTKTSYTIVIIIGIDPLLDNAKEGYLADDLILNEIVQNDSLMNGTPDFLFLVLSFTVASIAIAITVGYFSMWMWILVVNVAEDGFCGMNLHDRTAAIQK